MLPVIPSIGNANLYTRNVIPQPGNTILHFGIAIPPPGNVIPRLDRGIH